MLIVTEDGQDGDVWNKREKLLGSVLTILLFYSTGLLLFVFIQYPDSKLNANRNTDTWKQGKVKHSNAA